MPQNIFKIYDGRTNFWQWDKKQKLIVLDETITQVHFSNRNMTHSIPRDVYVDKDDVRVCNVPDDLLKIPRNLVAYAYADDATVKSVKFAVMKRPMPSDYISDQSEELQEIERKLDSKADDIFYDKDGRYIQLTANGELIGSRVELPEGGSSGIEDCKIDENGHLVVTLSDGKVIDAGYVGSAEGVTFVPHISEDKILTWTNDGGLENPKPVDLNPFDEWTTLPDEGVETEYKWEFL